MSIQNRFPLPQKANPGNGGTASLYDNMPDTLTMLAGPDDMKDVNMRRFKVVAYVTAENATFYQQWAAFGSTNLRTINGSGSGETITAGTLFERNCLLLPGRNVFTIVNGATAPTVWEVSSELDGFGGLEQ